MSLFGYFGDHVDDSDDEMNVGDSDQVDETLEDDSGLDDEPAEGYKHKAKGKRILAEETDNPVQSRLTRAVGVGSGMFGLLFLLLLVVLLVITPWVVLNSSFCQTPSVLLKVFYVFLSLVGVPIAVAYFPPAMAAIWIHQSITRRDSWGTHTMTFIAVVAGLMWGYSKIRSSSKAETPVPTNVLDIRKKKDEATGQSESAGKATGKSESAGKATGKSESAGKATGKSESAGKATGKSESADKAKGKGVIQKQA
jgi:hypothetical protein